MKLILIKILLLVSLNAFCQRGQIIGTLTSSDPLLDFNYLTLELRRDSTLITGATLDARGNFKLENINEGIYSLAIKQLGFRDAITEGLKIMNDTIINLSLTYPPPCNFSKSKRPKCIGGHLGNIIPIVYGLPDQRLMKKSRKGKIYLGGCTISDCDPQYYCTIHKKEL